MKITYEVRTGWLFLDKIFYSLEDARNYVEEIKHRDKKPKFITIIKYEIRSEYVETTRLDNEIRTD